MKKIIFMSSVIFVFVASIWAIEKETEVDWPMFRGPNGSGVYETKGLPLEFGPDKNVIWKTSLPPGHSSPVLTQDYIFVTAIEDEKLLTICLDRNNGKILWRKESPRPRREKIDNRNSPASPSPATDGKNVYVFFSEYGILGYDFQGNELWRYALGPFNNLYGMGASPIVVDDRVVLVCDQNIDSFIIAWDKMNGKMLWKTARPEAKSGHSTPVIYHKQGAEKQIIVPGSFLLTAYSLKTGEKIWWVGGLSFEMKSTPVFENNILYINGYATPLNQPDQQVKIPPFEQALEEYDSDKNQKLSKKELPEASPYNWFDFIDIAGDGNLDSEDWNYFQAALASLNGMLAIKLGGTGDMSESNMVWNYRRSVPQLPSPLLYQNVLYMINDGGRTTTFKPENGEVISEGRIRGSGSHFYASPVASDNKVFIISLRGIVSVLKPGGSLELLASNDLHEQCYATPAIADGRIYIRTVETLYCFGQNQ